MLNYPKSYDMLAEEELEYTSGGSDVDFMLALAAGGLAGLLCIFKNICNRNARTYQDTHTGGLAGIAISSILYVVNGENIRNRKKAECPEKYLPDADPAKRKQLVEDTKWELTTSPLGAVSLAGFTASSVCILVGAGITIANIFEGAKKK